MEELISLLTRPASFIIWKLALAIPSGVPDKTNWKGDPPCPELAGGRVVAGACVVVLTVVVATVVVVVTGGYWLIYAFAT